MPRYKRYNGFWVAPVVAMIFWFSACDDSSTPSETPDSLQDSVGGDTDYVEDTLSGEEALEEDSSIDTVEIEVIEEFYEPGEGLANIYPNNPIEDYEETTVVTLPHITDPYGYLTGPAVKVTNCLNQKCEGDPPDCPRYDVDLGGLQSELQLCIEVQTVHAEADGNYLSVLPPDTDRDPDDSFAEVNMYYHVNRVRDFFKDTLLLEDLNEPIDAMVNVQVWVDLLSQWIGLENAAYIPKESIDVLTGMFGIDYSRDQDTLVFLQADNEDMAYESDVIYHEYTHSMIGTTRLSSVLWDEQGLDNSPGSMNEAFADYFAASLTESPLIGSYALGSIGGLFGSGGNYDGHRDLTNYRSCPGDLWTEVHADGEMFSSALWEIRQQIGGTSADRIFFDALVTFDNTTNFTAAAESIIAQSTLLEPSVEVEVRGIFEDHGLINCPRVKPLEGAELLVAHTVEGTMTTGLMCFTEFTPGYNQFYFDVAEGTKTAFIRFSAESAGMMGLPIGGGGEVNIEIAFKRENSIHYSCDFSQATHDAHFILVPVEVDGVYQVALSGDCLVFGRYYMQFLNKSEAAISVTRVEFEASRSDPGEVPTCE